MSIFVELFVKNRKKNYIYLPTVFHYQERKKYWKRKKEFMAHEH